ncbi:MAG: ThiF family adenylyltransferase [Gammaproteobacteria bacterium]
MLSDAQIERYSRHILLPEMDISGQEKLVESHALLIGAGGLGSPAAIYLVASGLGELTICDDDRVDLSNLQRQIVHSTVDVGKPKVRSAKETLNALNPEVRINCIAHRLYEKELNDIVESVDAVVDASDNFTTRFAVNRACVETGTPLISGAVIRTKGQLAVFNKKVVDGPCYQCLYDSDAEDPSENCSEQGVFAPLAGVIGSMMACETIKIITGIGKPAYGRLTLFDAENLQYRSVNTRGDPDCPICRQNR